MSQVSEEPNYLMDAAIRNLREARKELKRGFPISAELHLDYGIMLLTSKNLCKHCGCPIKIRNLSGVCDHLKYPKNCELCTYEGYTEHEH